MQSLAICDSKSLRFGSLRQGSGLDIEIIEPGLKFWIGMEFLFWMRLLLTVGSFLLTMELFYLQLTILAFLLTVGAFLLTVLASLLTAGASLLTVGQCV